MYSSPIFIMLNYLL